MPLCRRTLLLLPASAVFAQSSGSADARKTIDAFLAAVKNNDVAAAERFLADDLIYTHSTGVVETKSQYLAKLRSGDQKYSSFDLTNPVIRTYGNAAVLNSQIRMQGATKGVPFDNNLFIMQVWAKQGGSWKLVAHQTTRKQ
jgi:ketosteroid isomerase-like protein